MGFSEIQKKFFAGMGLVSLAAFFVLCPSVVQTHANVVLEKNAGLGVIKGVVRNEQGAPIADAIVAVFQLGSFKALRQVRSAIDGSFLTKVLPGKYAVVAVAEGYNATTISDVQVSRFTQLNYGFKLVRAGEGNTLPEKKIGPPRVSDRVKRSYSARSIYQVKKGDLPVETDRSANESTEANLSFLNDDVELAARRRGQTIVETYFAGSDAGVYSGFNFATLQSVGENTDIVFSGQTGTGSIAPQRFQTSVKSRLNADHLVRVNGSVAKVGKVNIKGADRQLGQLSLQGLDEWKIRNGVILVLGFDYSRFVGGKDSSLAPRFGLQFDVDAKTRFSTSYTTQNEERTWSQAIDLEDNPVLFREQSAPQAVAVVEEKPVMNKSRRLEFGIERVIDNNSSIEASAFLDSFSGHGVSLSAAATGSPDVDIFTTGQQGEAQGARIVYTRRVDKTFSVSAGYAFGNGQKLSQSAVLSPANLFENGFFQTVVGQVNADLKSGTQVKTIFRLSPQATVFAIDPFAGRLAIYDPSLSVLVTQSLPTLGLPIRAEAILDARNLLNHQIGVTGEERSLNLYSQRRTVRGGILVRF